MIRHRFRKTIFRTISIAAFCALCFIRCSIDVAGGFGSETGTEVSIIGVIVDTSGELVPQAVVTLLPDTYNPVTGNPVPDSFTTTTDQFGRYSFKIAVKGNYNIQVVDLSQQTNALISDISIQNDTIVVPPATLKDPGIVTIFMPDTVDTIHGYLCFIGTTLYRPLKEAVSIDDTTYAINFASVPMMNNGALYYGIRSNPSFSVIFADTIVVTPNDTTILDFLRWVNYTRENSDLVGNRVNDLLYNIISQTIWAATNNGISSFNNSIWTTYTKDNTRLPSDIVNDLALYLLPDLSFGTMWAATDSGAVSFINNNWTVFKKGNSGLPSNHITSITIDSSGSKWFSTKGGGLAILRDTTWTVYDTVHGLPSNTILQIGVDKTGIAWCVSNKGVARFDSRRWVSFSTNNSGIFSDEVFSVAFDNNNNVWFGCRDGVSRFNGSTWTNYTAQSSSSILTDTIFTILFDNQDNALIGTSRGLTRFNGEQWFDFSGERYTLLGQKQIRTCAIDVMRNTWAGTASHGIIGFGFAIREE